MYYVAETIYNPAERAEDGRPAIIAEVGDLWNINTYWECANVGIESVELTYMGYPFTAYLDG